MASPKAKTTAKTAQARATRSAYRPSTKSGATAQDSAASWKQQSAAQLYRMPFNAEGMGEATRQAAANATEMWRTMWDSKQQQWGDFFANTKKFPGFDAANAAEQMNVFNRESGSQFTRSAGAAAKVMHELFELTRENTEMLMEAGNQSVEVSKGLSAEVITFLNRSFAQNVELSKEVLACRTLNDMFDLASRFMKTNLDGFFSQTVHVSETLFEEITTITEPLSERVTETSERLTKAMAG